MGVGPCQDLNYYFPYDLKHSLGYLNQPFGLPVDGSTGGYKGDPSQPFPWLTANGRPYVSPLELLLVPVLPFVEAVDQRRRDHQRSEL